MICGGSDMSNGDEEIVLEDDVPNIEWFFNSSMFYSSIIRGGDLPSYAFFNSSPIWVVGSDQLAGLPCDRARQGQSLGLQTMVCIPWANGVVELVSTDAIFHGEDQMDLIKKVRVLFNSNSLQWVHCLLLSKGEATITFDQFWQRPTTFMQRIWTIFPTSLLVVANVPCKL